MKAKISLHVNKTCGDVLEFAAKAHPAWFLILCLHETNFIRELHSASPTTELLGRHYDDSVALERPEECADIFWRAISSYPAFQQGLIRNWVGPNEMSTQQGDNIYQLLKIDTILGQRVKDAGHHYWMLSTSERQPPDVDNWNWTRDMRFRHAAQFARGVNVHAYWWPTLNAALQSADLTTRNFPMGDPLRHERWHDALPIDLKRLEVIIGEIGPDAGVVALPHKGWFGAYGGDPVLAMADITKYDHYLMQRPEVQAGLWFCVDSSNSDWWDFAVNREPRLMTMLGDYIAAGQEEPATPFGIDKRNLLTRHASKSYSRRELKAIDTIVIHHTAISATVTAETLARVFVREGWPGMAYHFYIRGDGEVSWCLPLEEEGGHTLGHNGHTLGVAVAGTYTGEQEPSALQLLRLTQLMRGLQEHVPTARDIKGHREITLRTACPGGAWLNKWRSAYTIPNPYEILKAQNERLRDELAAHKTDWQQVWNIADNRR